MPSEEVNEDTRREWRELGFFYDRDDDAKAWRVVGTKPGLARFADLLAEYASDPDNDYPSEHDHFGPYMYLEIGTWADPVITEHWLAGPPPSLLALATRIRDGVGAAGENQTLSFRELFSPAAPYDLRLEVRAEPFDPAKEDPHCW